MSLDEQLALHGAVGYGRANRPRDVARLQVLLGAIAPAGGSAPFLSGLVDGRFSIQLGKALAAFAEARRLPFDGGIAAKSPLHRALVSAAARLKPPARRIRLVFSGGRLCWHETGRAARCWPARRDPGAAPGTWTVGPDGGRTPEPAFWQRLVAASYREGARLAVLQSVMPAAWPARRLALERRDGRALGLFVHGGEPGAHGLDLGPAMVEFAEAALFAGEKLPLDILD